jgi:2-polyprenyl-6-hydroxyphenyl methylase/3-demethylubiquinone-9 3-methyltransferase
MGLTGKGPVSVPYSRENAPPQFAAPNGMTETHSAPSSGTDPEQLEIFKAVASDWWNPSGPFKPLHALGPVRIGYIREQIIANTGRDGALACPLEGVVLADIGCGGGLLCEPLARLGANVTGIDPLGESIETARRHCAAQSLEIRYLTGEAADLAARGEQFDAVVSMEVVEHVPDLAAFVRTCAVLVKPGGLLLLSTLNRTLKSYAMAIAGAEYILRWLPKGTHQWDKFVKPDELAHAVSAAGLSVLAARGCTYHPFSGEWRESDDTSVNYFMAARKPA